MPTKASMIFSQLKADLAQVRACLALAPIPCVPARHRRRDDATRMPRRACCCDPRSSARLSAPVRPQITGSAIQKSYPPALPSQGKYAAPVPPQMAPPMAQAPPFPQAQPMMSMHPVPQASTVAFTRACRTAGGQRTDCSVHAATAVADARAGTRLPYLSRACACAVSATALCPDMQDSWALTASRRLSRPPRCRCHQFRKCHRSSGLPPNSRLPSALLPIPVHSPAGIIMRNHHG